MTTSLRRAVALLFTVAALAACGSDSSTAPSNGDGGQKPDTLGNGGGNPGPIAIASIEVAPVDAEGSVLVGWQRQFRATLRAADGSLLTGRAVSWSISHADRGTIDEHGTVTARQPGLVMVTATSEGKSGSAQLEITPRTVARFEMSTQELDLGLGQQKAVQALPLDAMGQLISDAAVTWSSADPNVATVDNTGLVGAMQGGETTVTVSSGNATATVRVRVPRTVRLVLKSVSGNALPALLDSETTIGDGVTHRIRWVAKGGFLDLSTTGDMKWRQEVQVTVYEDLITSAGGNSIVSTTEMDSFTVLDEGTRVVDAYGALVFQSSTAGRAPYATRINIHGGTSITQRPLGYGPEQSLYFAQP